MRVGLFILCLILVYSVAFIGGLFTSEEVNSDWYLLNKPSLTPPNWIFPIVWNILFFLIALSLYFAWSSSKTNSEKMKIALIYGINLLANALWSMFYFGMHQPLWAFVDLIIIICTILLAMIYSWKIDKKASWLLVPYLLWVAFAGILNYLTI